MPQRDDNLILVDAWDEPIGTATKQQAHKSPLLHRAFSAFLMDGEQILLQRRAEGKYHSGGLWANACCSHPRMGEEVIPSAQERLREELGMTCPLREIGSFVYCHRFPDGLCEYEYDHVLVGYYHGSFLPDPEEIAELRWVSTQELDRELRTAPEEFAVWFRTAAPMVLRWMQEGKHV